MALGTLHHVLSFECFAPLEIKSDHLFLWPTNLKKFSGK